MKNTILKSFGLGIALTFGLGASAQCLNLNGDFESFTGPIVTSPNTASNAWINDDLDNWYVSHGSPTTGTTPTTNMWMWSYYGAGEGVYTEYNFVAGVTYELCYSLWRDGTSSTDSEFRVELSNTLSPYYGTSSGYPSPAGNTSLTTQPWTGTGTWVTITETFTPASSYNQLWMHPFLAGAPTPWQAACRIDSVCIKEVVTDPCDFDPVFKTNYDEECNVNFDNVTAVPPGFTILETYWDFGDGTTGTGSNVDHFYTIGGGGVYTVCMTVWMINDKGDCCKLTVCEEIDAPECDPCEWIERAEIIYSGSNPYDFSITGLPSGLYSLLGYHWDFGDMTSGTGNPISHTYASGGGYTVCVTLYYYDAERRECCSAEICIEIEAKDPKELADDRRPARGSDLEEGVSYENTQTNVEMDFSNQLILSPNPSNGQFEMRLKDGGEINTISVYDQTGKLIYNTTNVVNSNRHMADFKHLESGAYIIIINETDEMHRSFEQLIIE